MADCTSTDSNAALKCIAFDVNSLVQNTIILADIKELLSGPKRMCLRTPWGDALQTVFMKPDN